MKKLIVITLLITFCSVLVVPQNVAAEARKTKDSTGEALLIGAGIALVTAVVVWVAFAISGKPQKVEEPDKEGKLSEDSDFILDTQKTGSLRSYSLKDDMQEDDKPPAPLFSLKVEF